MYKNAPVNSEKNKTATTWGVSHLNTYAYKLYVCFSFLALHLTSYVQNNDAESFGNSLHTGCILLSTYNKI